VVGASAQSTQAQSLTLLPHRSNGRSSQPSIGEWTDTYAATVPSARRASTAVIAVVAVPAGT
jgi:hypothetical protein